MFLNALRVHSLRSDPFLSYLIDFEDSIWEESFKPTKWEDLNPGKPDYTLTRWELEMREGPED